MKNSHLTLKVSLVQKCYETGIVKIYFCILGTLETIQKYTLLFIHLPLEFFSSFYFKTQKALFVISNNALARLRIP